ARCRPAHGPARVARPRRPRLSTRAGRAHPGAAGRIAMTVSRTGTVGGEARPWTPAPDAETTAWLDALNADGHVREEAIARLHALLLRAARFEVARRLASAPHQRGDLDDIALQSADDALIAVLAKLGDFRGHSRFTTWAYKFALL